MNCNESDPLKLARRSYPQVAVESTIAFLMMFLAVSGNLLMIVLMYKKKHLRTTPNAFVLNLAVADLLLALTIFPFFFWTLLKGEWRLGAAFCQFLGFQNYFLFAVTLLTLISISINRYILIVYPHKYRALVGKKSNVLRTICAIWVSCALTCAVPLVGWGRYSFNRTALCAFADGSSTSFRIMTDVFLLTAIAFIVCCNVLICRSVRQHRSKITDNQHNQDGNKQPVELRGEDIHITRTISILVALFCICWLPCFVTDSMESARRHAPRVARMFGIFTIYMDSLVNPIVYGMRNRRFRAAFREALLALWGHSIVVDPVFPKRLNAGERPERSKKAVSVI